jgi:uncharacterized membrane protein HdeD (DUF308 family)
MHEACALSSTISGNWWGLAIRGLVAIVLGVLCFVLTGMALVLLVALIVAYLLVDGFFALVFGLRTRSWMFAIEGAVGVVAGVLALFYPHITLLVLAFIIAAWAIVTGALELWSAFRLRGEIRNGWVLVIAGLASLIFGVLMFVYPGAGLVTIIWLIGAYGIVFGISEVILSLSVRSQQRRLTPTVS